MGHFGFGYVDGIGSTPEDHQQVIRSQWYNADDSPMVRGGTVTGRANLAYDYSAGVGLVRTAAGAAYVTWAAGTTVLVSQPSSTRTDTIYADKDGVKVTTGTPPANVAILDKRQLVAGASSTGASTSNWDRRWAVSRDGTLGFLAAAGEVHAHLTPVQKSNHIVSNLEFWVPTDRWVDYIYQQCITSLAGGDDRGTTRLRLFLDNALFKAWEGGYDRRFVPDDHTVHMINVSQGTHTLRLERYHAWGADPLFFGGGTDKFENGVTLVVDKGVKV